MDELENAFRLLSQKPTISRLHKQFKPPVRMHHCNKHLIIYVVVNSGIKVVRVLHQSMDYESELAPD